MAPEQVLNEPPDARTDIFAVAAMLHEMLAGGHYLGVSTAATGDFELRRGIVERPPSLDPRVPKPIAALLRKGLAKRREERFQDAAEMRRAIAEARRVLGLPPGA